MLTCPAALLWAAVQAGCQPHDDRGLTPAADAEPAPEIASECNPFDEQACLLPWPSAVYLEKDGSTETGLRIALPAAAMPANRDGTLVDAGRYNQWDGFSASHALVASFPTGVNPDGLPPPGNIDASLAEDAPIVLLNMDTGERHPFFAEVDANALSAIPRRPLLIRPMKRLAHNARYAVAIRDGVRAPDGDSLPMSSAFRAMRDGDPLHHPRAQKVAARYDEIFAALKEAGVERTELRLAWDFVTVSDASLDSDLRAMTEQALTVMGDAEQELGHSIGTVEHEDERVLRHIEGTFEAPNFLTAGEDDDSVLLRDDSETPRHSGTFTANLTAIIPACAEDDETELPLPVVLFGHGLFGSAAEYMPREEVIKPAEENCHVFVGTDWIGLTPRQVLAAAQAAGDLNRLPWLVEKLAQGVVNFLALEHILRGPLGEAELFRVDGEPIVDPDRIHYLGVSLGGIMGGVLMAHAPAVERAALGVSGGPWGLVLERSWHWTRFQGLLFSAYQNQLTYQIAIALAGMSFEPYDPMSTAARLLEDPGDGATPKQIFMYQAMGDSVIQNLGTELLARTIGLKVLSPTVALPWGMEIASGDATSALVLYDEGIGPLPPNSNLPPEDDNGTHDTVRATGALMRQLGGFFDDGVVRNECRVGGEPAPCDCTTGACD